MNNFLLLYLCGCIASLFLRIALDQDFAHHWWNKPRNKYEWKELIDVIISIILSWITFIIYLIRFKK